MNKIFHFDQFPEPGGVSRVVNMLIDRFGGEHNSVAISSALRQLSASQADVLVVHTATAWSRLPYLAALRLKNRTSKIILVEHHYTRAFEQLNVPHKWRFRALLKCAYGLVDHVVSVSRGQAQWMKDLCLVLGEKIAVIPCTVDLARFERIDLPRSHSGPMRLGALGRLYPQKGFETLIEAMRAIAPEIATLEIAGSGPLETDLKARAQSLPHVTFRGWTDPVGFYAAVDAIVMPSLWEPGAVACWEARAAGRPMIVSDVDGLPEQVPMTVGFVTKASDAEALAHSILELANADRLALAQEARRSTSGSFERALEAWGALLTRAALPMAADKPWTATLGAHKEHRPV